MRSAATAAHADAVSTTGATPAPGSAWTRYGPALPTVRAPTTVPTASPRRARNQVATIFIAGGYTPASASPVAARQASARRYAAPGSAGRARRAALATAPATALAAKSRRA